VGAWLAAGVEVQVNTLSTHAQHAVAVESGGDEGGGPDDGGW
jgi:hypothetical protein